MDIPWLLLIYTVPAEPSRKRAAVWRELKKVGAPYLRDGVCILPERPDTRQRLDAIAARVQEFGGDATLVSGARLSEPRAVSLVEQFRAARAEEYDEIAREADRLLEHVARIVAQPGVDLSLDTLFEFGLQRMLDGYAALIQNAA